MFIERSDLSGKKRKIIVKNLLWVPDIKCDPDPSKQMIYWADNYRNTLEMSDYDGMNRKVVYRSPNIYLQVSNIAVYKVRLSDSNVIKLSSFGIYNYFIKIQLFIVLFVQRLFCPIFIINQTFKHIYRIKNIFRDEFSINNFDKKKYFSYTCINLHFFQTELVSHLVNIR